jgi:hypothetical protein
LQQITQSQLELVDQVVVLARLVLAQMVGQVAILYLAQSPLLVAAVVAVVAAQL